MISARELHALADRLFAAIANADGPEFLDCFEADGAIVRNGGGAQPAGVVAQQLDARASTSSRHSYSAVRRETFPGGFVEEHEVRTTRADDTVVRRHSCVVARTGNGGRIAQMHEYIGT